VSKTSFLQESIYRLTIRQRVVIESKCLTSSGTPLLTAFGCNVPHELSILVTSLHDSCSIEAKR